MAGIDLGYAAGLFDGEGTVGIYGNPLHLRVAVAMTDKEPLDLLMDSFGGSVNLSRPGSTVWRPCYRWLLTSQAAKDFLSLVSPWLIVKRVQAWLALEFMAQKHNRQGTRTSSGELALREGFAIAMQRCNGGEKPWLV